MRPIYLALVSIVLLAAICFAVTSFVDSHYGMPSHSAESVSAKMQTTGGPFAKDGSKGRDHNGPCPGGVCHRHDDEIKVDLTVTQPTTEQPKSEPLWIPLVIGGVLLVILVGAWLGSAFEA